MPKRTNEFQKLVKMLQHSLSGDEVKISESAMESVEGLGFREIDILIEGKIGIHQIKIAVEAKDHSRKIDVTAVESIISKYYGVKSVPVNKVILVSSKGFTSGAIQKAKSANIELMTIQKALSHNWVQHKNVAEVSFYGVGAETKMGKKIESEKLLPSKIDFDVPCAQERVCKKPCIKHFYNKTIEDSLLELFQRHVFNKQFRHNMIQGCKAHNKEEATLALRYDFPPQSYIKYEGNRIEILSIFAYKLIKVPYLPLMPSSEMPFDFSLPLHIGGVRFEPHLNDIDNKDFFNNAMVWCKCQKNSKELGTFRDWLDKALQRHKDSIIKSKNEHQEAIEKRLQKEGGYTMTISMPMNGFLLKYNDHEYLFETLHVDFIERRHKTMMKFESYNVNQSEKPESCIHYGTAELPNGGKFRILMPNGMMSEKIVLDIEGLR